ncbi:hypothetical protein E2C01_055490 [Portunus trituberculatus]|uniref:Uncharacterized protein n=1 Tax=Portunus trituberculatus TaxID=210409 RepID=A0A5B7GWZ2_PORTR|nr:hypothetical protein [Portunus trituberculatus]
MLFFSLRVEWHEWYSPRRPQGWSESWALSGVFWGDAPSATPSRVRPRFNARPELRCASLTPPRLSQRSVIVRQRHSPARHSSLPVDPGPDFYLTWFVCFNVAKKTCSCFVTCPAPPLGCLCPGFPSCLRAPSTKSFNQMFIFEARQ